MIFLTASLELDEMSYSQLGSLEYVIFVITTCKKELERSNSLIVYDLIEAYIPTAFQYKGDIQQEIIRQALDQITSLEQDANLPENLQRILKELKCFYEGGAKRDGRVDNVAKVFCCQPAATARTSQPSV
ncbi:hypothetical protein V490_00300 [Pseudogymnoascus sp. VKM F-3557]|nr:hypothetical protein V490_00300 [Pseudogymnoascus sp. VKM F-3557]